MGGAPASSSSPAAPPASGEGGAHGLVSPHGRATGRGRQGGEGGGEGDAQRGGSQGTSLGCAGGAAPARVLRRGGAPPPLHARGRRALRDAVRAVAAGA